MDYSKLAIPEHRQQPKFMAWLAAAVKPLQSAQNCLNDLHNRFDIDKVVGIQLDKLGDILGVPRKLPFQPSNGVSPIMDDENYRLILKAAIIKEHFDGTIPNLMNLLQSLLGNMGLYFIIIDNQDMSMEVIVFGKTSSLIKDELEHDMIIPRPEGVSMTVNVANEKVFSWGLGNEVFSGWSDGYWLPIRNNF